MNPPLAFYPLNPGFRWCPAFTLDAQRSIGEFRNTRNYSLVDPMTQNAMEEKLPTASTHDGKESLIAVGSTHRLRVKPPPDVRVFLFGSVFCLGCGRDLVDFFF